MRFSFITFPIRMKKSHLDFRRLEGAVRTMRSDAVPIACGHIHCTIPKEYAQARIFFRANYSSKSAHICSRNCSDTRARNNRLVAIHGGLLLYIQINIAARSLYRACARTSKLIWCQHRIIYRLGSAPPGSD